jgi:predicted transcriptional regulator
LLSHRPVAWLYRPPECSHSIVARFTTDGASDVVRAVAYPALAANATRPSSEIIAVRIVLSLPLSLSIILYTLETIPPLVGIRHSAAKSIQAERAAPVRRRRRERHRARVLDRDRGLVHPALDHELRIARKRHDLDPDERHDGLPARVFCSVPGSCHILLHMKQLLIEVDDETAAQLEQVAPARSRRRSEFIRTAIRQALWNLQEHATAEAYRREPDSAEDPYVDAAVWEPRERSPRRSARRGSGRSTYAGGDWPHGRPVARPRRRR